MPETPEKRPEFDSYAGDYAALLRDPLREKFAPESRFFAERKLQIIREFCARLKMDTREMRWLDVGCGQGDLLRLGRTFFAGCGGCDVSAAMIGSCGDLEVREQLNIDRIPWDEATFDLVTAVCVFHHVPDEHRRAVVKEMMRVLKPGGLLCIIEHNPLNPITRLVVARSPVDVNAKLLSAGETRRLFASTGPRVLKTRYFLYLPEAVYRSVGLIERMLERIPFGGQYAVFARMA